MNWTNSFNRYDPKKSAEKRRGLARVHDTRRLQTAMPPSSHDMDRNQRLDDCPNPQPTWIEKYSPYIVKCYKDTKQGMSSCLCLRGAAGWKRRHWLCCKDLIGIDLCFKTLCPCCCCALYMSALEKADIRWYRFACLPCNRAILATQYGIDEPSIQ